MHTKTRAALFALALGALPVGDAAAKHTETRFAVQAHATVTQPVALLFGPGDTLGTDPQLHTLAASAWERDEIELGSPPTVGPAPVLPKAKQQTLEAYGRLPLVFFPNAGQANAGIRLFAQGPGFRFAFQRGEVLFALTQTAQARTSGTAVALRFLGARPEAEPEGGRPGTGRVNYLLGNDPTRWRTGLPTYGDVVYRNLWPGIDLAFRGQDGQLKYELEVEPGARPADIGFAYTGAERVRLGSDGSLVIDTALGPLTDTAPVSYQEIDGRRMSVESRFVLDPAQPGAFRIEVGTYEPAERLFIDPGLVYSTFLGTLADERGYGIAVDGAGSAYVAGFTYSTGFPTTPGTFDTNFNGTNDVFVTKLNPAGSALVYSTYLGGFGGDEPYDIAVDASGNAYVTGFTDSVDFPTTPGSFLATDPDGGHGDGFVTKLSATGSALVYSTYLGAAAPGFHEQANGIALDAAGNAYIVGVTSASNFPTTPGAFDTAHNGGYDVFVTKLNLTGTAPLVYSTFMGGGGTDVGNKIRIDGSGNAYLTGYTSSTDFPATVGAFDTTQNGNLDAFAAKLNASGTAPLLYSSFLGGAGEDVGVGIAIDSAGNAYVTGYTASTDFPTTPGALDTTHNGVNDAFVTKLNPSGAAPLYSTFLGGSLSDVGFGIAVDGAGAAHITGQTGSADFPTTADAFDASFNGGSFDAFVTKLNPSGMAPLVYSTFLGGNDDGWGRAIAVDSAGTAYVTGQTRSNDFPTTPGAFRTIFSGGGGPGDAFVTKLDMGAPPDADAGPDQAVDEGTIVTLDGSQSSGLNPSYFWEQIAGPAVVLADDTTANPSFGAPLLPGGISGNQTLTFQLTITDGGGQSDSDTVDVTVKQVNNAPIADAGQDQTVDEASLVALSAANSYDPDTDAISCEWVQTCGSAVTLSGSASCQPSFAAPQLPGGWGSSETLCFKVTVSDTALSTCDTIEVMVEQINHHPTADAGPDQTKFEASLVTLDGNGSGDPDGDTPLSYAWVPVSGPSVALSDATSPSPSFTAPAVGPGGATLVFRLSLFDGQLWNDPLSDLNDEVTITVQNFDDPPECNLAQASPGTLWPPNHKLISVGIVGVTDPDNNGVTITVTGVTQDEPTSGLGGGDSSPDAVMQGATVLLRAERAGGGNGRVYRVSFEANDGNGGICSGAVNVGVPPNMNPGNAAIDDGQAHDSTQP